MREIGRLVVVFLIIGCAIPLLVRDSPAQVPFVQLEFSPGETLLFDCGQVASIDTFQVVAYNLNMGLVGFDLRILYPHSLLFLEDIVDATQWQGSSNEGITVAWQDPQDGFHPVQLFRVLVMWTGGCNCYEGAHALYIEGFPGKPNPTAVSWPDLVGSDVLGHFSLICATPPNPIQAITWGQIKALYR